jgi:hypothetical protein
MSCDGASLAVPKLAVQIGGEVVIGRVLAASL